MQKYNHAFTIAFSLETESGSINVTAKELLDALQARVDEFRTDYDSKQKQGILDEGEDNPYLITECCGMPFDSYEVNDSARVDESLMLENLVSTLEKVGYSINENPDQPGKFTWTYRCVADGKNAASTVRCLPQGGCESSFDSKVDAIISAWMDASSEAMAAENTSDDEWDKLTDEQRSERIIETLIGDVASPSPGM